MPKPGAAGRRHVGAWHGGAALGHGTRTTGCLVALGALLLCGAVLRAADEHSQHVITIEKPRLFWTTPIAVKFQLAQLSNAELLLVERDGEDRKYIPVYSAILSRPGLPTERRLEAIEVLIAFTSSDAATVLLAAIQAAGDEENTDGVLNELGHMLLGRTPEELLVHLEAFEALPVENEHPVVRRIGYAGQIVAGRDLDAIWEQAEEAEHLTAVLGSLSMIRTAERRVALYPRIKPLLAGASDENLQGAAIEALAHVPGHDAEIFRTLAAFVGRGLQVGPAVRALSRMDRARWPADRIGGLAESIVAFVRSTPPDQRAQPHVVDAVQLGNDLAGRLSADRGAALRKTLRSLGATVILLRTVRHEMRYEKKYFAVQAGRPVQIILDNVDVMPHNVVVVKPGTMEAVGIAAETMQPERGNDRPFIPAMDEVLFASRLVQPNERDRVSFAAPEKPGDYPYVCTYPGHWRVMYGVMVVVEDLDAWLADPVAPADPLGNTRTVVRNWTLDDLAPHLASPGSVRRFDVGKRVFTEAGCVTCHKMRGQGGQVGPELTDVFERLKGDRRAVLREILEPSAVVNEPYQVSLIETIDGEQLFGLITARDEKTITLVTNPQNPVPFQLPIELIEQEAKSKNSLMPVGALSTFTQEEILDLLAYLESAGHASHKLYRP